MCALLKVTADAVDGVAAAGQHELLRAVVL